MSNSTLTLYSPYTQSPNAGPYLIFPTHAHEVLSYCVHLLGCSITAFCFANRTSQDKLDTLHGWMSLSFTKLCVIALFVDSWLFLATTGILVNGIGLTFSPTVCALGIYCCVFFYAGSKGMIYCFLVERVWIVHSSGSTLKRRNSLLYKFCISLVLGFIVIFVLMVIGRVAEIRKDGMCIIGLRPFASIPLVTYDLFVNMVLTFLFVWPLYQKRLSSTRLRHVAKKTLVAAGVALATSLVNLIILIALNGRQLGWVCLASCSTDVTVNALVLFWVTANPQREELSPNAVSLPGHLVRSPRSGVRESSITGPGSGGGGTKIMSSPRPTTANVIISSGPVIPSSPGAQQFEMSPTSAAGFTRRMSGILERDGVVGDGDGDGDDGFGTSSPESESMRVKNEWTEGYDRRTVEFPPPPGSGVRRHLSRSAGQVHVANGVHGAMLMRSDRHNARRVGLFATLGGFLSGFGGGVVREERRTAVDASAIMSQQAITITVEVERELEEMELEAQAARQQHGAERH